MTPRQRAQVVELLRCAADSDGALAGTLASWPEEFTDEQCSLLVNVHYEVHWRTPFYQRDRVLACLETAQRVEDGEWP